MNTNKNEEIKKREIESGFITYKTLADYVEDMILCNNMGERYGNTLELENGNLVKYYDSETNEELSNEEVVKYDNENIGNYYKENEEIYQYYIISDSSAEFLKDNTNEIIFYDNELDLYVWGITHFGTSWDYVFTDIKINESEVK